MLIGQSNHYLKAWLFGVQESSHNWNCKGSVFPKVGKNPFEEMEILSWLILTRKTNIIYRSIQTWYSPLMEGVFYIYLMLRHACVRYFLFFHQMITLQKLSKMLFISSKKPFLFWRYLIFCNFFTFYTFQIRNDKWKWNNL